MPLVSIFVKANANRNIPAKVVPHTASGKLMFAFIPHLWHFSCHGNKQNLGNCTQMMPLIDNFSRNTSVNVLSTYMYMQ